MPLPKQLSVTGKELVSARYCPFRVLMERMWLFSSVEGTDLVAWGPSAFFSGKIARLDLFGGGQGGIETC